jgi:hypothetical protein
VGRSQDGEVVHHPSLSARAAEVHGAITPRKPCTAGKCGRLVVLNVMMCVRDAPRVRKALSRNNEAGGDARTHSRGCFSA